MKFLVSALLALAGFALASGRVGAQNSGHPIDVLNTNTDPRDPALPEAQLVTKEGLVVYYLADEKWDLPARLVVFDGGTAVETIDVSQYRYVLMHLAFRDGFIFSVTEYNGEVSHVYLDLKAKKFHTFEKQRLGNWGAQTYVEFKDRLFYTAAPGEVKISDGTAAGTQAIPEVGYASVSYPMEKDFVLRDSLYFHSPSGSYVTDGTAAGTHLVATSSIQGHAVVIDQTIYRPAYGGITVSRGYGERAADTTIRVSKYTEAVYAAEQGVIIHARDEYDRDEFYTYRAGETSAQPLWDPAPSIDYYGFHVAVDGKVFFIVEPRRGDTKYIVYESDGSPEGTRALDLGTIPSDRFSIVAQDNYGNMLLHIGSKYLVYSTTTRSLKPVTDTQGNSVYFRDTDHWQGPADRYMLNYYSSGSGERTTVNRLDLSTAKVTTFYREFDYEISSMGQTRTVGDKLLLVGKRRANDPHTADSFVLMLDPRTLEVSAVRNYLGYAFAEYDRDLSVPSFGKTEKGKQYQFFVDYRKGHCIAEFSPDEPAIRVMANIHPHDQHSYVNASGGGGAAMYTVGNHVLTQGKQSFYHHYKLGNTKIDTFELFPHTEPLSWGGKDYVYMTGDFGNYEDLSVLDLNTGVQRYLPTRRGIRPPNSAVVGNELVYQTFRDDVYSDSTQVDLWVYDPVTHTERNLLSFAGVYTESFQYYNKLYTAGESVYFIFPDAAGNRLVHRYDAATDEISLVSDYSLRGDRGEVLYGLSVADDALFITLHRPTSPGAYPSYFYHLDLATGQVTLVEAEHIRNDDFASTILAVASLPDRYLVLTDVQVYSVSRSDLTVEVLQEWTGDYTYFQPTDFATDGLGAVYRLSGKDGIQRINVTDGTRMGTRTLLETESLLRIATNNGRTIIREGKDLFVDLYEYHHATGRLEPIDLPDVVRGSHYQYPQVFADGFAFVAFHEIFGYEPHFLYVTGIEPLISTSLATPPPTEILQAFPNPTSDLVRIPLPGKGEVIGRVYSAHGVPVLLRTGRNGLQINLGSLPGGVYQIEVSDRAGRKLGTARVVRE